MRLNSEAGRDPIKNEFIGKCRVVGMALRGPGFLAREYLEGHVPAVGF